jgi:TPR repeat protein
MLRHFTSPCLLAFCLIQPLSAAVSLPVDKSAAVLPTQVEGPAKEAMAAFEAGRHARALELARPLAEDGNSEALYLLGFAHETGQGVEASRDKALEFYKKAADRKHKDAVYRMSFLLLASDKAEEREKAGKALEAAVKDDPAVAGRILGEAYLRGLLTETPDPEKAVYWWTRSADSGDIASLLLIARFYEGQFGFPEKADAAKAVEHYAKAAGLGNAGAMASLGSRYLSGDAKVRNEEKGREWLKKAIASKEYSAYLVLGDFEENVKKDPKAALAFYDKGKDAGHLECMMRSADFYLEGKGVDKDEDRGRSLLLKAAEAGHPMANLRVAAAYFSNEKISPADGLTGYAHLLAAANANLPQAQHELGLLYLSGKLGIADGPAGVAWLTRAAKGGHPQAQFNLGSLYVQGGGGVEQNIQNAAELFALASNQGHTGAMNALAQLIYRGGGKEEDLIKAWVLAKLALEGGEKTAEALVDEIHAKLTTAQRKEAQEQLAKAKSGNAPDAGEKKTK